MTCSDTIILIAAKTIRTLLRLPAEEIFEDVEIPVRTATGQGVSISYKTERRIRYGLSQRHDSQIQFRTAAKEVGSILAQHHDLTPLIWGAGPTCETEQETAGVRFLSRLIDATIGGAENGMGTKRKLVRICKIFEAQLEAGEVGADWIYPLPGLQFIQPFHLSPSIRVQDLGQERLELLHRYAQGGFIADGILLQTATVLSIRKTIRMPFSHSRSENSEELHRFVLAFLLSSLPLPVFLTSWPESREPSVFELGQASTFAAWSSSPLAFARQVTLTASHASELRRTYRLISSCPEEIVNSLPVRRALSAVSRQSYEDKVIDLWIALEALLLRGDEMSELQYRMALRAAWIVRPATFREFERAFKRAYGDRSKVVHGSRHVVKEDNIVRCNWTFSLLREIIGFSLREKCMPNRLDIEDRMLLHRKTPEKTGSRRIDLGS